MGFLSPRRALPALVATALACAGGVPEGGGPPSAERLVTLAPSITETVFAVGVGERVVGVDAYSHWPPEVEVLPRLGGLFDPNLEAIAALEPDLALLLPSQRDLGERLAALGIEVLVVPSDTLDDVERAVVEIARRCGVSAAGEALVEKLRRELAPAAIAGGMPAALVVGRQPGQLGSVLVAAPGTYFDELLSRLDAANVFADAGQPYPQVGLESFFGRRPRLVVELHGEPLTAEAHERLRADWRRLPGLELAEGCLAVIDGHEVLTPGPRLPVLYRRLRRAIEACA